MQKKQYLLAASAVVFSLTAPAFAKGLPDLKPSFNVKNGVVKVKNGGDSKSKRVYVTIRCQKIGGGSCPDPNPIAAAPYENPLFPNRATVKVPRLNPGKVFGHKLKFFKGLNFKPGKYRFIIRADPSNIQPESNEANNLRVFIKTVP